MEKILQIWDIVIEFLGKVNAWIPLVTILIAGAAVIVLALILGILGCIIRKHLLPHWLIWLYFTFAMLIIFAAADNNIYNVVAWSEVPLIVLFVYYLFRAIFWRNPKYIYVPTEVYECQIAKKGHQVKETVTVTKTKDSKKDKNKKQTKVTTTEVAEMVIDETKDDANLEDAFATTVTETTTMTQSKIEDAAKTQDEAETEMETAVADETTVKMPEVEPMTPKTYEPVSEPTVVNHAVMQNLPDTTTTKTTTVNRPTTTTNVTRMTTTTTNRPATSADYMRTTTTTNRPTTAADYMRTTTAVNRPVTASDYMRTTTTTTNTTTSNYTRTANTNTTNTASATNTARTAPTTTTARTTTTTATNNGSKSTQDIMAAIERLRASMKNNQ